eukprot:6757908-Alexandrium_andersonii.AAC.1
MQHRTKRIDRERREARPANFECSQSDKLRTTTTTRPLIRSRHTIETKIVPCAQGHDTTDVKHTPPCRPTGNAAV